MLTSLLALTLVDCSNIAYPTTSDVESGIADVPPLNTIGQGRSYIAVVRNSMIEKKNRLQGLQGTLDAGMLAGVVATGLGTALQWGYQTNTRLAIFSAAVLGVDSSLSIPQQVQILNKGLDALVCVESQAEADWIPVKQLDASLEPVNADIDALSSELAVAQAQASAEATAAAGSAKHAAFLQIIDGANASLTQAQIWLPQGAVPVANINAGVKIGVDQVLQTTVDQLSSVLPDASAFTKLTSSFPAQTTPSPAPSTPNAAGATLVNSEMSLLIQSNGTGSSQVSTDTADVAEGGKLSVLVAQLNNDLSNAQTQYKTLNIAGVTALPTVNCPLSGVVPSAPTATLHIASISGTTLNSKTNVVLSITGGTAPYSTNITVVDTSLTPGLIVINSNASKTTLTLVAQAHLKAGVYYLIITDATGTPVSTQINADGT